MRMKLDASVLDLNNPIHDCDFGRSPKRGSGVFTYEGKINTQHVFKSKTTGAELKVTESAEIDEAMKKIDPQSEVSIDYLIHG